MEQMEIQKENALEQLAEIREVMHGSLAKNEKRVEEAAQMHCDKIQAAMVEEETTLSDVKEEMKALEESSEEDEGVRPFDHG